MRVCMIVEDYPPKAGGGGLFVRELSQRLSSEYSITVLTPAYNLLQEPQMDGQVKVLRFGSSRLVFFFKALWHMLRSPKFDLYHGHGVIAGALARFGAMTKWSKSILHVHGFRDKEAVGMLKYFGQNLLLRLGHDRIISVDEISSAKMEALGIKKESISTVPVGLDLNEFQPYTEKQKNAKPVFLFVGRLEQVKDLPTLLKAAKSLHDRGKQAEFWIVGEGKQEKELKAFAAQNGLDNVKFMGAVPHEQLAIVYNRADFLVLPSLSEGMPLVLLEGMACGLPIIVSDAPSLVALAQQSKAGFVFPRMDVEQLVALFDKCIAMDERNLVMLGQNARAFAQAHYSWDNVASAIKQVYDLVLGR